METLNSRLFTSSALIGPNGHKFRSHGHRTPPTAAAHLEYLDWTLPGRTRTPWLFWETPTQFRFLQLLSRSPGATGAEGSCCLTVAQVDTCPSVKTGSRTRLHTLMLTSISWRDTRGSGLPGNQTGPFLVQQLYDEEFLRGSGEDPRMERRSEVNHSADVTVQSA